MEWLNELVRWRKGRPERIKRVESKPCAITVNGQPWTFATDGRNAVYLRGENVLYGPPVEAFAGIANQYAAQIGDLSGEPIDLAALRAFVGEPVPVREVPCEECGGSGTTTCPECECERTCRFCNGSKLMFTVHEQHPVRLLGDFADGNDLAFLLRHLPGVVAVARWHTEKLPQQGATQVLQLASPDWLALLTGLVPNSNDATVNVPEFGNLQTA